jgi:hypothetical protein
MINQVPGRLGRTLTSPFELVHGVKPDARTWFELFSVGFFKHTAKRGEGANTKTQEMTLDGIAVGRDRQTNTILFYNPLTKSYYRPQAWTLDKTRLPITHWPTLIKYDGSLHCGRYSNRTDPIPEPFPPGTRVQLLRDNVPKKGTIANIPLVTHPLLNTASSPISSDGASTSPPNESTYVVHMDDGTTLEVDFAELAPPEHQQILSPSDALPDPQQSLPVWLRHDSKVTMDARGAYHKGYIDYSPEHKFRFVVRKNQRSRKIDWFEPLPDFVQHWTTLVADDILLPGHGVISSFLKPNSSNNAPSANFVSAKNLLSPCPPSLVKALHPSNPDRRVWLDSYNEEKGGLESLDVFERINKKTYLALKRSGRVGSALPSMCVLVVKPDKDGKPHRAKSRIVVLGNHEDRYWSKSQRYAPVLKYVSLRMLASKAAECKRILQQGDCKNAFCQAYLPDDECTVVRPPVGDPGYAKDEFWLLKKTLYGLRRSPHHWYNMFTKILTELGLQASPHDPCVYTGVVNPGPDYDPATSNRKLLHIGIYVDDFVYFSENPAEEKLFQEALASRIKVDFMGDVDYFLGTAFTWMKHEDGHLSVHLCQSAFIEYLAHRFALTNFVPVPNMTPYRSGMPIDSIPNPDPKEPDFKRRRKIYQSIVGCINWLATCTRPDVSPALTFLASYSTAPHIQHYKSALHVIKYLISTADYGISFHSNAGHTTQAYNHFPVHHDREAYTDATPRLQPSAHASRPSPTLAGEDNSGMQFQKALPSSFSNLDPSRDI